VRAVLPGEPGDPGHEPGHQPYDGDSRYTVVGSLRLGERYGLTTFCAL
jgi:hypothetical protein